MKAFLELHLICLTIMKTINDSGIYSKGKPTDLMKYNWYHGNISEEQADIAIDGNMNRYLVRHSENKLILSYTTNGWKSHDIIHHTPIVWKGRKKCAQLFMR